jgi:pyrroline-5-carboxylate reductase
MANSNSETTAGPDASLRAFPGTLLLVGAGKMGGAMLEGWQRLGLDPRRIVVLDPQPAPEVTALAEKGLRLNPPAEAISNVSVIVLAVKPQTAPEATAGLQPLIGHDTLVLSIMAGRTLGFLEQALPGPVVRAMPNTPAAVARGITVAVANQRVSPAQRERAHLLLTAIGAVEWIDDEALMDAVTAVSGSGPAYVFLLAETLARAGEGAGLPAKLAQTLARATIAGSGELLHRSPLDAATLRQNVTSPGGTTAAALEVLHSPDGLQPLLTRAVAAATKRSRELAG